MSKHAVRGGDVAGLLERFAQLRKKALARTGKVFPFVVKVVSHGRYIVFQMAEVASHDKCSRRFYD